MSLEPKPKGVVVAIYVTTRWHFKGTNRQHSGQMSQNIQN